MNLITNTTDANEINSTNDINIPGSVSVNDVIFTSSAKILKDNHSAGKLQFLKECDALTNQRRFVSKSRSSINITTFALSLHSKPDQGHPRPTQK